MLTAAVTSHGLLLAAVLVAAVGFVAALVQQQWTVAFLVAAVGFLAAAFLVT